MSDYQDVTESPFRFRLERVRNVRERKEKLAQRELAQAISRHSSSMEELKLADADVERALTQQRGPASQQRTVSATELQARQAFLERVEATRLDRANELQKREAEVAIRDAELATAASEHKMLERLAERQRREHERELARREVAVLDELTAARFRGSQV